MKLIKTRPLSIALILIVLGLTSTKDSPSPNAKEEVAPKTAYEMYYSLNKSLSMMISQKILHQKHLQTMWYVDYEQVRPETDATTERGVFEPLLRMVTTMRRGVYFKRFKQTWRDLGPRDDDNTQMDKLFEHPVSNPITASHMERNQSLVAVAYKNLTVEVIDIRTATLEKKDNTTHYVFNSVKIDTSYKYGREDDHEVLAIGQIPGSEYLILSSNRFEILKIDKIKGKIILTEKNPLEKIGIIAIPSLSHLTKMHPFNPKSIKDPQISKKNMGLGQQTIFMATGADDPMNAIIDWTTLKPIRFLSNHLAFISSKTREEDIIGSLVHYGGAPQIQVFAGSTIGPSPTISFFSLVSQQRMFNVALDIISANKKMTWVYATTYLSIFYPAPIGSRPDLRVYSLHNQAAQPTPSFNDHTNRLISYKIDGFDIAQIFLEKGKLEKTKNDYWAENVYDMDSLFLAFYNRGNSIRIEPPAVYWDHCLHQGFAKIIPEFEIYMFYGRMMACPPERGSAAYCRGGLQEFHTTVKIKEEKSINNSKFFYGNRTFVNCVQKRCPSGQIAHFTDPFSPIKRKRGVSCLPKFELDEKMRGFANDNGCKPGYNKNHFGVCHSCFQKSSDCVLFGNFFRGHDSFTLIATRYTRENANKIEYYKDYRTRSYHNFISLGFIFDLNQGNLLNSYDDYFTWKFQNSQLTIPCYVLRRDRNNDYDYVVDVKAEYTLAKASKYPQYNISQQISEIYNGTLTMVVCIKECEVGYFYEFKSLSCRKCNIGCGVCSSFEECEECIPGYNKVKDSVSHKDIQEGYPVGFCRPGCQPGFYSKSFDGTCVECPADCLSCRDKSRTELENSLVKGIKNQVYCIQCREKDSDGLNLYSDHSTGECVNRCDESMGFFTKEFTSKITGNTFRTCGECHDPNCHDCGMNPKEGACVTCKPKFSLNKQGVCESYWKSEQGILIIAGISFGSLLALVMIIGLCLYVLFDSGTPEQQAITFKQAHQRIMTVRDFDALSRKNILEGLKNKGRQKRVLNGEGVEIKQEEGEEGNRQEPGVISQTSIFKVDRTIENSRNKSISMSGMEVPEEPALFENNGEEKVGLGKRRSALSFMRSATNSQQTHSLSAMGLRFDKSDGVGENRLVGPGDESGVSSIDEDEWKN